MKNWLNIQNKADKTVEIDIEGVIGGGWFFEGVTMEQVNKDLKEMKAIEADNIKVNIINSPGGSVLHGLGIIDILNSLKAEKQVHILGMAASMAAVIAMVAPKEKRTMTKNSWFLVHRITGGLHGTIENIKNGIEFFKKSEQKLIDLLKSGTGKTEDDLLTIMNENEGLGNFQTAEEAKKNGFIGKIEGQEPVKMAAFAEQIPQLPTLPKNLLSIKDEPNMIEQLITGLKSLFEAKPENKEVKHPTEAEVMAQVQAIRNEFKSQLTTLKNESQNMKSENETLKAKLNGKETPLPKTPDPSLDKEKSSIANELSNELSDADKRRLKLNKQQLNKN